MCPGGDSNPHASRRYHLKVVSLPISPPGHRPAIAARRRGTSSHSIQKFELLATRNPLAQKFLLFGVYDEKRKLRSEEVFLV